MQMQTFLRVVSPEYFGAMGLHVLAGRSFDRSDTSTSKPVVVVNKTFAAKYLPMTPVGSVLPTAICSRHKGEVIGIVDGMRQGGLRGVPPSRFGVCAARRKGSVLPARSGHANKAHCRGPRPGVSSGLGRP